MSPYLRTPAPPRVHVCPVPERERRHYIPAEHWAERHTKPDSERPYATTWVPDGEPGAVWICAGCRWPWKIVVRDGPGYVATHARWVRMGLLGALYWRVRYWWRTYS